MTTMVPVDHELMQEVARRSGERSEQAVVEAALRLLPQSQKRQGLRDLWGTVQWQGDLEESRLDRSEE